MDYIKGVNLGGWLVLEKWMSPALFEGTEAADEYYLPRELSAEAYENRIRQHRCEFISERDFAAMRRMGLNAVRIPIPYFIFGDRKPFIGCIDELDKAFLWAEKYGLRILIDLHTVPMSQNGFDNGGICGVCRWSQLPEEVEFVLALLEKLSRRYGHRKGLLGIEPLNEPVTEPMWTEQDIQHRYVPRDPELAKGSAANTLEFLYDFYDKAYDCIRPNMADDKYIVFHDAFRIDAWKEFMTREKYRNIILDTHQYLMMAEEHGCAQTVEGYMKYIQDNYVRLIEETQKYVPAITGEWCIFNSLAAGHDTKGGQNIFNGAEETGEVQAVDGKRQKEIYQAVTHAQLEAWKKGSGYFYWTYKMLLDTTSDSDWLGWDSWDLGKAIDLGWFE